MSNIPSATKYYLKQKSLVCTNPNCANGLPHYRGFGKKTDANCQRCSQPLVKIENEPVGTSHPR